MGGAGGAFFPPPCFFLMTQQENTPLGWPRVLAECDYSQPLYFEGEVEIHLLVVEKRAKVLTYEFRFRKLNSNPPAEVARGKLTVVCVTRDAQGKMSATPIPAAIADKIEVAPAVLLV